MVSPEEQFGHEEPMPQPGLGRDGIDTLGFSGQFNIDIATSDGLAKVIAHLGPRVLCGVLSVEEFDRDEDFLQLVHELTRQAEDDPVIGDAILDGDREPSIVLARQDLPQGGMIIFMAAEPADIEGELILQGAVNRERLLREHYLAAFDTIDLPWRAEPIMVPIEEGVGEAYYDENSLLMLSQEALDQLGEGTYANPCGVLSAAQLGMIESALMYERITGVAFGKHYLFRGETGELYRIYEFPEITGHIEGVDEE